jgi:hypothetical protein
MNPRKPRTPCLQCGKEPAEHASKYCSNRCQQDFQHQKFIKQWQQGTVLGLTSIGIVSDHIKRYLREKYDDKCCLCGWAEINPVTGKVPLNADHIDGNWRNNIESNLRLLCPNCDSLTPTYAALNKGRGRENRAVSKRSLEARELVRSNNL